MNRLGATADGVASIAAGASPPGNRPASRTAGKPRSVLSNSNEEKSGSENSCYSHVADFFFDLVELVFGDAKTVQQIV